MKNKIILWLRQKIINFLFIDEMLCDINRQQEELNDIRKIIKERTEYHVNIHNHPKTNSQVILIGRYRNRDFVKCYSISDVDFNSLIFHLQGLEKYSTRGKFDTIPEISACIKETFSKNGF